MTFYKEDSKEGSSEDMYGRGGKGYKVLKKAGETYAKDTSRKQSYGRGGKGYKVLKKAGETYAKDTSRKQFPTKVEGEEYFYSNFISLGDLNENLKDFGGIVKSIKGGYKFIPRGGDSISVSGEKNYFGRDFLKLKGVSEIAENLSRGFKSGEYRLPPGISRDEAEDLGHVYTTLSNKESSSGKRSLEKIATQVGFFTLLLAGFFFVTQRFNLTGFVVRGLTDARSNVGMTLSFLGMVGAIFYLFIYRSK